MRSKILVLLLFLCILPIAYSVTYPIEGLNPFYNELAIFINQSIDSTTGLSRTTLNTSIIHLNVTGIFISGTINSTYLNVSRNLIVLGNIYGEIPDAFKIANYSNQYSSTGWKLSNDTTAWHDLYASVGFKYANVTEYLGGSGSNNSLIRAGNMTGWVRIEDQFDSTNATSLPFSRFTLENVSNNTLVKGDNVSLALWNISDSDVFQRFQGNLNLSSNLYINISLNFTSSTGNLKLAGSLDANSLLVLGSIVQVEKDAFKLSNYSSEYASTGYKLSNFTSHYTTEYGNTGWKRANTTDFLGGSGANDSLVRAGNMTGWTRSSDGWQLSNDTTAFHARYAETGFKYANATEFLGGTGSNNSLVRAGNMTGWVRVEDQYELSNFTTNYNARADRFGISNATALIDNSTILRTYRNVTSQFSNHSLGNFTIIQFNASCVGFKACNGAGTCGGIVGSCFNI